MKRWLVAAVAVPVLTTVAVPLALVVGTGAALSALSSGPACAGTTSVAGVSLSASGRFTAEQRSIAATASTIADQQHLPARAKIIILAVGFQESGVRNLDHGDRDSVGWLQQRAGWGSVTERMNPGVAARKFYDHLVRVPGWSSLPVTVAAQRVQVSGFPGAYAKWETAAAQLLASVTAGSPVAAAIGSPAAPTDCAAGGDVSGDLQLIAVLNPQGAGNWQGAVRSGAFWYVAHATAGDRTQVFHRLNSRGVEIDQMTAVGFRHATSFAAAGNTIYATDGHWNVVSFLYRPGVTIRSGTPTGWRGYISKDPTGSAVVIRNGNHYRAYNVTTRQPIGVDIRTDPGPRQGFSISGTTLYVLSGPTNQPARVDSYSFTTGARTGTRDITTLGAAEAGSHREPEGMYGATVGVKTNTGTRRRLRVYAFTPSPPQGGGPSPASFNQQGNPRTVEQAIAWLKMMARTGRPTPVNSCAHQMAVAYGWPNSGCYSHGGCTALALWYAIPPVAKTAGMSPPPRGALVFWRTGSPAGHVDTSLGQGMVATTDAPGASGRISIVPITTIDRWGPRMGWALPYWPAHHGAL